jgi:hypothetical protein
MTAGPATPWPRDGVLALLAWVLVDDARTRRLRSLLVLVLPAAVTITLGLAVVAYISPLAATALGGGLTIPSVTVAWRHRRPSRRPSRRAS